MRAAFQYHQTEPHLLHLTTNMHTRMSGKIEGELTTTIESKGISSNPLRIRILASGPGVAFIVTTGSATSRTPYLDMSNRIIAIAAHFLPPKDRGLLPEQAAKAASLLVAQLKVWTPQSMEKWLKSTSVPGNPAIPMASDVYTLRMNRSISELLQVFSKIHDSLETTRFNPQTH